MKGKKSKLHFLTFETQHESSISLPSCYSYEAAAHSRRITRSIVFCPKVALVTSLVTESPDNKAVFRLQVLFYSYFEFIHWLRWLYPMGSLSSLPVI